MGLKVDCLIIGSGLAGYSAALQSRYLGLDFVLIEGAPPLLSGGMVSKLYQVVDYPGFEGSGNDLIESIRNQIYAKNVRCQMETVSAINLLDGSFQVTTSENLYTAATVIIATGRTSRRLHLAGEDLFWGKGISDCAVCDGALPFYKGQSLLVVGGGDKALSDAVFLSDIGEKVIIVHRGKSLRASQYWLDEVNNKGNIEVLLHHQVLDVMGGESLESVQLIDVISKEKVSLSAKGLFYALGGVANTRLFEGQLDLDEDGSIRHVAGSTKTSIEGVFVCGSAMSGSTGNLSMTASSGCQAAREVYESLQAKCN